MRAFAAAPCLLSLGSVALLATSFARAAVVGLTADLEMWPDDRVYLNVTATAAEMVRRSGLGLRYSVAADITLMYETTLWNGSLTSMTSPRPYYQALMDQVDEVLLMDYGQTTAHGLCGGADSDRCALAKPLWWTAPWLAYAESLRRISDGRRQVLTTMGLPVDAGVEGERRGWFASELQLENFISDMSNWSSTCGFTTSGSCANATGWATGGPFHKTAIFMAALYQNMTLTRPCPTGMCKPGNERPPRALWLYQSTADAMIYQVDSQALSERFFAWCAAHGVDELYLYPARIRGCPLQSNVTTETALATFVKAADHAGISVQFFVGVNKGWASKLVSCAGATLRYIQQNDLALRPAYHKSDDSPPVDLTAFETHVLPSWLRGFQVFGANGTKIEGAFRQKINGPQAPYGTADVVHLLSTVNQLNISASQRDIWASVLASYQNLTIFCNSPQSYPKMDACPGLPGNSSWSGFYSLEGSSGGWEPWHSSGDITASFRLLDRQPAAVNEMYIEIASNSNLWEETFDPIVFGGIHKIIGILGTLLMQRPNARQRYASFLHWFAQYIDRHEQNSTGFLCNIPSDIPRCKCRDALCSADKCLAEKLHKCVAPTFATNMIKHIGLDWNWHLNRTAQRTILDLQLPTGLWSSGSKPGYHDIDALFIAVRTLPWNPDRREEVQAACAAFLKAVVRSDPRPCSPGSQYSDTMIYAQTTFSKTGFDGAGLNDASLIKQLYTNTHDLAAPIYAVSVCAQEFPSLAKTIRPWSFSGDRAPFI